jgi:hypothetical protein
MAFKAKDGSHHHSASRAAFHDKMAADKAAGDGAKDGAVETKPKGDGADGMEDGEDVSHMPIHEVVAKHGPAEKVEMEHDHEGGKHTKTSHHGGKKHVSEHENAAEAHEHGMMAAGVNEETPDEEDETPNDANRHLEGEEGEVGSIPGMS